MLSSTMLVSEDDKRVSKNKGVEAARYRVNNRYRVLMLSIGIEFFIGLDFYFYYFYSGCALSLWSHVLPECSVIT